MKLVPVLREEKLAVGFYVVSIAGRKPATRSVGYMSNDGLLRLVGHETAFDPELFWFHAQILIDGESPTW